MFGTPSGEKTATRTRSDRYWRKGRVGYGSTGDPVHGRGFRVLPLSQVQFTVASNGHVIQVVTSRWNFSLVRFVAQRGRLFHHKETVGGWITMLQNSDSSFRGYRCTHHASGRA